jgi:hypothetical protein
LPTVDTDETKLAEQARPIANLRKQLAGLWPPHVLTESEKDQVIAAVSSIVGYTYKDDNDLPVRMAYEDKSSAVVRVNLSGDRIFIEPINPTGYEGDHREGPKIQGNSVWWTDQSERIRAKMVDEWRWGKDLDFSITFAADGTFRDRHPWGRELRGRWSVDKEGAIKLTAENKAQQRFVIISNIAQMNLKEDTIRVGNNSNGSNHFYDIAIRYKEREVIEADIPGVWVHSPGAFPQMSREMTLLPNGKINDPASGHNWSLKGKALVLRWADPGAPGGFWVDTCTAWWTPRADRLLYSGLNQQKLRIAGHKGTLPPWFEKAREEAPAGAWEECRSVPGFFWTDRWRKVAAATIERRNRINAEIQAQEDEYWRRKIEEAGREASRIWNAPGKYTPEPETRMERLSRGLTNPLRGQLRYRGP